MDYMSILNGIYGNNIMKRKGTDTQTNTNHSSTLACLNVTF